MSKQQRTVLITGCSDGGLGCALAVELQKVGYRVFATTRNTAKMTSLPDCIERLAMDVTSTQSIKECADEVAKRTGGTLSMLINNAGVWHTMPFADVNVDAARIMFDVNFWGQFQTTQAFLPLLLKSQQQGHGTVVALNTSLAGGGPTPFSAIYGASKAAADYAFDVLRLELSPWNIHVVSLKTGAVKSNMVQNRVASGEELPKLPGDSLYQVARDDVEKFMAGKAADPGIPAEQWAQMVVKNLEKEAPPRMVWGGAYSTIAWAMQYLPVPSSMMQGMVNRITGLEAVQKAVQAQK